MLLWASVQAVPASLEKPLPLEHRDHLKSSNNNIKHHHNTEWKCTLINQKLCRHFQDTIIHKRMKHRRNNGVGDNSYESTIRSSKNLHERQVRSFEHVNKIAKNNYPHDKNTFVNHESANTGFRNISLDNKIMNNGGSVSVESISESTLATFKESDVKTNAEKETSDKIYLHVNGSLKLVFVLLTVLGILIPIASIIYCFWTTRRSATSLEHVQRRLADNDNNLLNQSLQDLDALMLSVQNLGCAGMERLGIPASTAMGSPLSSQRDDSRSIRRPTFPRQHDLKISANRQTQNLLDESKTEPKSGIKSDAFESNKRRNMYTSCSSNTNCPPHIHRHDGEFGRDRYLNNSSQHDAEIQRSFIQAPPNKSVQDVPDATQSFHFGNAISHRQLSHNHSKGSKTKKDEKTKSGLFTFVTGLFEANSSSHKIGNAENKLNSNTASMPRSQSSYVSTDTSNVTKADCSELVINGSTNYNLHSKSYVNNNDTSCLKSSSSSPGAAKSLRPSSSSSLSTTSSSGPSPEHNCL